MKIDVVMPQMGESVAEGTIVTWLKKAGDWVEKDEILLEISTDKVDTEIPSPAQGKLVEILVPEGETVPVGTVIARIESEEAEEPEQPVPETTVSSERAEIRFEKKPSAVRKETGRKTGKRFYSPVVRAIANSEGLTAEMLEAIPGSGAGNRVTKKDILDYIARRREGFGIAEAPQAYSEKIADVANQPILHSAEDEIVPMNHIRKAIARHMTQSLFTAPHVTSVHEADITGIMERIEKEQEEFREKEQVPLTLTAFVVEAAVQALKEFPIVNASIDGENIVYHKSIHIGIAVAVENGLVVPVIRHAEEKNFLGIARAVADLANRARTKQLSPDEVTGSTFSITNYGVFGTILGTPIINQPNAAILGIGAARKRPVVVNDAIAIRWIMYPSLTYDHRLIDGATGGQFMKRFVELLENYSVNK
ncbi:MAG: 2-oxo acid dehydrogenase subunit E2 [Calditrichaeota bacterium]|nr:2-oxo acid dehydrogenase subunit E2 [Calditrichota bacterium]